MNKILDGGFGKEISKRGLPFKRPEWSASVIEEKPEAMVEIHHDYIRQGAQIITTNTYAIMPIHIGDQKFQQKAHEMIQVACEKAREAKEMNPEKNIQIACSVPPLSSYTPEVFLSDQERAKKVYKHFLEPLAKMEFLDFYLC